MEPEPPKSVPGLVMKMNAQAKAPSCMLIIFGAAGDLTKRLLVPALCHLRRSQLLPEEFAIIGVDRAGDNGATFRRGLKTSSMIRARQSSKEIGNGLPDGFTI